jgi:hypothetical protein
MLFASFFASQGFKNIQACESAFCLYSRYTQVLDIMFQSIICSFSMYVSIYTLWTLGVLSCIEELIELF